MGCGSEHAGGPLGGRSKYSCIYGRSYSSGLRLIMSSSESPPPIGIDREHTRIREFLIGSVVTFYRIDRTLSCGRTGNTVGYTDVRRFPCPGCRQYRARRADSMNSQHFRRVTARCCAPASVATPCSVVGELSSGLPAGPFAAISVSTCSMFDGCQQMISQQVPRQSVGSVHRLDVVQPDATGFTKQIPGGLTIG